MASSFAADLATLTGEAGTSASLRTVTSAYNPTTGANVPTNTDVAVTVVISSYTVEEIAGGLVERGDMKATLPAAQVSAAPTTAAKLVLGGVAWSIVSVTPRYAGGSVLSYAIQVRR